MASLKRNVDEFKEIHVEKFRQVLDELEREEEIYDPAPFYPKPPTFFGPGCPRFFEDGELVTWERYYRKLYEIKQALAEEEIIRKTTSILKRYGIIEFEKK